MFWVALPRLQERKTLLKQSRRVRVCVVEFDVFKYVKQKFLAAIALIGFPLNNYGSSRCENCACSVTHG